MIKTQNNLKESTEYSENIVGSMIAEGLIHGILLNYANSLHAFGMHGSSCIYKNLSPTYIIHQDTNTYINFAFCEENGCLEGGGGWLQTILV